MKNLFLFACLSMLCLCVACDDETVERECFLFQQDANWTGEALKSDYTIQFPATYLGDGFSANGDFFFHKYRADNAVTFYWSLCGFAGCEEYAVTSLATPFPANIIVSDDVLMNNTNSGLGLNVRNDLTEYVEFCSDGEVVAVYYYNILADTDGAFFIKFPDGQFYATVLTAYDIGAHQEVLDILETILPSIGSWRLGS